MAPEVVKNEPYSAKVDIWSLGCTVIEMFTGQRPWLTLNQIATLYNVGYPFLFFLDRLARISHLLFLARLPKIS